MNPQAFQQSPIFSKTSDFILWLLNHTEKYPKSERFRLARRLEDSAFDFYELLIQATRSTSHKKQLLLQADLELDKIRLYIRMALGRKLANHRHYRYASGELLEIGKLLGGWLNSLKEYPLGEA